MITVNDKVFHLDTNSTSYVFRVTKFAHLENIYYGAKIAAGDYTAFVRKDYLEYGNQVIYDESDRTYCMDNLCLEYSSFGKGDFRHLPLEVKMPDKTFVSDFVYIGHEISAGIKPIGEMPCAVNADDGAQTLTITLKDKKCDVIMRLYYTVFVECDTITRRVELENRESEPLSIRKIMSLQLDLPDSDYILSTFDGSWIKERKKNDKKLISGLYVNESTTGTSSSRHNPFIMLSRPDTGESSGECIGVNLIYSGNHYEAVDVSTNNLTRVMTGINPHCFEWILNKGETFETPEAVLTFSKNGFGGLTRNTHDFIKTHISRGEWANKERPVLYNNWEGTYFDFNKRKLSKLAKSASKLGIELFVLDDGWFGERNDDASSLGDWFVNKKKLRGGIKSITDKVNKLGMKFGLWFEPEMISEKSRLFASHPEYAVKIEGRTPSLGRKQLVIDLTKKEVRDYIVKAVSDILSSANIEYVKWDMNRNLSDIYSVSLTNQGAFFHSYILGLYDVLERITKAFPKILFESCASGGGRFDLGMLCYMPQTWTSDNTDAYSRLSIQSGTSYGYALNSIAAHVGSSPSHQTLRRVSLETRFNVAAFGVLGYELDLGMLTRVDKKIIKNQIEFYKANRRLFQFGDFLRVPYEGGAGFMVMSKDKRAAALGIFEGAVNPNNNMPVLKTSGLDESLNYSVSVRPQKIDIRTLGSLINHVSPVKIKGDGVLQAILGALICLDSEKTDMDNVSGYHLNNGYVKINQRFVGTGYTPDLRLLSDFDSRIYMFKAN